MLEKAISSTLLRFSFLAILSSFSLFAIENKTNLEDLGVPQPKTIIKENTENYVLLERQKKREQIKESSLSLTPHKDLKDYFEQNEFDIEKAIRNITPKDAPVQLQFDSSF